ncbi:MAG: GTPase Era, partial [Bacteroidota bacterium]
TVEENRVNKLRKQFGKWLNIEQVFAISALEGTGINALSQAIQQQLPEGPAYYPKDQLTDRPERFFVTEIIREQILEQYHQEIPYSVEVEIETFTEGDQTKSGEYLTRISAIIYVSRKSQKPIIIGKGGAAIKKLGTHARERIEAFLQTKVYLELHVKIQDGWRDNERELRKFGYDR